MKKIIVVLVFSLASPYALSADYGTISTDGTVSTDDNVSMGRLSYKKTMSHPQYIAGGVTSIFTIGGIGHAIQGRWLESGWIFTAGTVALVGGFFTLPFIFIYWDRYDTPTNLLISYGTLSLALLGLRIWEIISAWNPPSHYKIVKAPKFQLTPLYIARYKDTSTAGLGLSFKYRF